MGGILLWEKFPIGGELTVPYPLLTSFQEFSCIVTDRPATCASEENKEVIGTCKWAILSVKCHL